MADETTDEARMTAEDVRRMVRLWCEWLKTPAGKKWRENLTLCAKINRPYDHG